MLYAATMASLFGIFIVFRDHFADVWWLGVLMIWPFVVLMQLALIREGLVALNVTGRPEAIEYYRRTMRGMMLSIFHVVIVAGIGLFMVIAIARESGVTGPEYNAFGLDYVTREVLYRNPSEKAPLIVLMCGVGAIIFSALTSAILTIPLAGQAAMVDGEHNHSLLYGAAFKSFQVIATWIVGNVIFFALYIGVALIFSFGLSLKVPKEVMEAFLNAPSLTALADLSQYSMIDFISGMFIFIMLHIWWTAMWAASSAVAYAEQRIDDKIRYEVVMDSYRHGSYEDADIRKLRKDREKTD